jgi:hypothetical protein
MQIHIVQRVSAYREHGTKHPPQDYRARAGLYFVQPLYFWRTTQRMRSLNSGVSSLFPDSLR